VFPAWREANASR